MLTLVATLIAIRVIQSGGGGSCDYNFECNSGADDANVCAYNSCVCGDTWSDDTCARFVAKKPTRISVVTSALRVTKKFQKSAEPPVQRGHEGGVQKKWRVKKVGGVSFMLPAGTPASRLSPLGRSVGVQESHGPGESAESHGGAHSHSGSKAGAKGKVSSLNSIWSNLFKNPHVSGAPGLVPETSNVLRKNKQQVRRQPADSVMPSLRDKKMRVDAQWSSLATKADLPLSSMSDVVNNQLFEQRMKEAKLRESPHEASSGSSGAQAGAAAAHLSTHLEPPADSTSASSYFDRLYSSPRLQTGPAEGSGYR
jgi:hypothetical protein